MASIDMCLNVECPNRLKCYRYLAAPKENQKYIKFEYDNGCKHFWKSKNQPAKQVR